MNSSTSIYCIECWQTSDRRFFLFVCVKILEVIACQDKSTSDEDIVAVLAEYFKRNPKILSLTAERTKSLLTMKGKMTCDLASLSTVALFLFSSLTIPTYLLCVPLLLVVFCSPGWSFEVQKGCYDTHPEARQVQKYHCGKTAKQAYCNSLCLISFMRYCWNCSMKLILVSSLQ